MNRYQDTITSIAAGDFDGDFQVDLLITTKPNGQSFNSSTPTKAFIYWGDIETMVYGKEGCCEVALASRLKST